MRVGSLVPETTNPFHLAPVRYTPWLKLKMGFVCVTLLPIRLAVLIVALLTASLLGIIGSIGIDHHNPKPPGWRRWMLLPAKPCARAILWALGYWWIKVEHRPGSAAGTSRVLVGAPHFSLLDAFVMAYLELPCFVSKESVSRTPVFGRFAKAAQVITHPPTLTHTWSAPDVHACVHMCTKACACILMHAFMHMHAMAAQVIFVDRDDDESKRRCIRSIKQRSTETGWPPLLVFPEGTCTNGSALVNFKPGAFSAGVG